MSYDYDVLVIGAGPGGYPAAIRAAQLGLRAACIEREHLGGVCLNVGCIPSKALLKSAEFALQVRDATAWGIDIPSFEIDYPAVIARSRKVAKTFRSGVAYLFKKYGVHRIKGTARLDAPNTVVVDSKDGSQTVTAAHIIVATGADARSFPGIEPDGERILTYREAIVGTERPDSVVVLGAGAIGIEFAYFWNAMGVDVTVVEGQDEILPLEDRSAGATLRKALKKQGIDVRVSTFVESVQRDGDGTIVTLRGGEELRAHTTLISLGITPNTNNLGLEEAGVELRRGYIHVDSSHRTSLPGVYSVGDCCDAGPALAHTATRQAHVCIERIAGLHVPDVDYDAMPSCTYCQPQVASVGRTEEQLRNDNIAYEIGEFPFSANGKAVGSGHPEGFVKVLVDPKFGEILGAHIVGSEATEMIGELVLARSSECTAEVLVHTTHAHPTATEATMEAVAQALGVGVHL